MKTFTTITIACALAATLAMGCEDTKNNTNTNPDLLASPDLAPSCVTNPTTHEGLLNACTDAESFEKTPFYPTLAPNGVLPSL